MPELTRFYGIVIRMFFDDHNPPHVHASYGSQEGIYEIESLALIAPCNYRRRSNRYPDLAKPCGDVLEQSHLEIAAAPRWNHVGAPSRFGQR